MRVLLLFQTRGENVFSGRTIIKVSSYEETIASFSTADAYSFDLSLWTATF
ncbi:MAG: hypothetical protein M3R52_09015 [Acidobacteriota bacterium]|nr:hypothetical protein [Acidobacteriota bacterium]